LLVSCKYPSGQLSGNTLSSVKEDSLHSDNEVLSCPTSVNAHPWRTVVTLRVEETTAKRYSSGLQNRLPTNRLRRIVGDADLTLTWTKKWNMVHHTNLLANRCLPLFFCKTLLTCIQKGFLWLHQRVRTMAVFSPPRPATSGPSAYSDTLEDQNCSRQ
jgi:hypothetical protein